MASKGNSFAPCGGTPLVQLVKVMVAPPLCTVGYGDMHAANVPNCEQLANGFTAKV